MSIWLHGPRFLYHPEERWPMNVDVETVPLSHLELKGNIVATTLTNDELELEWLNELAERCASWTRLIRMISWLTRFKSFLHINFGLADVTIDIRLLKLHELRMFARRIRQSVMHLNSSLDFRRLTSPQPFDTFY